MSERLHPPTEPPVDADSGTRRARDLVRGGLVLAAVGLGVAAVARDVDGFVNSIRQIGLWSVVLALGLTLLGLLVSAEVWRLNVASVAGRIPSGSARRIFFVSQLGKYLPGALWPVLAQIDSARRYQLSGSRMAIASLLFLALHMLTGLLVIAGLLPWAAPDVLRAYPWVVALVPLLVAGLIPAILGRVVDRMLRLMRRPPLPSRLRAKDVVAPCLWLLVTWLCYGLGTVALTAPLVADPVDVQLLAVALGGFAMAWVVGVLVLPAPAGIGPREVVFVLAFSPLVGVTEATSIAIVLRVIHTTADLLLAVVGRLAGREG